MMGHPTGGTSIRTATGGSFLVRSELMQSYATARAITSDPVLASALDAHGEIQLFSLGDDGELFNFFPTPRIETGWGVRPLHAPIAVTQFTAGTEAEGTVILLACGSDSKIYWQQFPTPAPPPLTLPAPGGSDADGQDPLQLLWSPLIDLGDGLQGKASALTVCRDAQGYTQCFAVAANGDLVHFWQDSTTDWKAEPIIINYDGELIDFASYSTEVTVLDSTGNPVPSQVLTVGAADYLEVEINGTPTSIGPDRQVPSQANHGRRHRQPHRDDPPGRHRQRAAAAGQLCDRNDPAGVRHRPRRARGHRRRFRQGFPLAGLAAADLLRWDHPRLLVGRLPSLVRLQRPAGGDRFPPLETARSGAPAAAAQEPSRHHSHPRPDHRRLRIRGRHLPARRLCGPGVRGRVLRRLSARRFARLQGRGHRRQGAPEHPGRAADRGPAPQAAGIRGIRRRRDPRPGLGLRRRRRLTLQEAFRLAGEENPDFFVPGERRIDIIPHGVDTGIFRPLSGGRPAARKRLLPDQPEFQDSFIVLNANRNQPRKRIDVTMQGFALFARDKPANVKLYLHMGLEDCGWNLAALARRLGIEERLILTTDQPQLAWESTEKLNLIYNACDIGINTSTGEGWGLVSFEHAATGAAQVVPRHSSCTELWEGAAELMEPSFSLTIERILLEGWFVTPQTVAQSLERLYRDRTLLAERSRQACARATDPAYCWDRIARQWTSLFDEVLSPAPQAVRAEEAVLQEA